MTKLLLAILGSCSFVAFGAAPSWIGDHAVAPKSDAARDIRQHIDAAIASGEDCVLEIGDGLLVDGPALLIVLDGVLYPRIIGDSEADALGLAAHRMRVTCTPGGPGAHQASLGEVAGGAVCCE